MREAVKKKIKHMKELEAQTHQGYLAGVKNDFYNMINGTDTENLLSDYYQGWSIEELKVVCNAMGWEY